MLGISEPREPIKGKFAKKIIEELRKMYLKRKEEAELELKNKEQETFNNTVENEI